MIIKIIWLALKALGVMVGTFVVFLLFGVFIIIPYLESSIEVMNCVTASIMASGLCATIYVFLSKWSADED